MSKERELKKTRVEIYVFVENPDIISVIIEYEVELAASAVCANTKHMARSCESTRAHMYGGLYEWRGMLENLVRRERKKIFLPSKMILYNRLVNHDKPFLCGFESTFREGSVLIDRPIFLFLKEVQSWRRRERKSVTARSMSVFG